MQQNIRWMPRLAALWLVGVGTGFALTGCGGGSTTSLPRNETASSMAPISTGNNDTNTDSNGTVSSNGTSGSIAGTMDPDSGSSSGATDGGNTGTATPVVLTEDETTAADASDQSGVATNGALEQISYLTESEGGRSVTRGEGDYPKVSTERTEDGFVVTVDYGTVPVTTNGGRAISGVFTITRNRITRTGTVVFTDVAINGRTISGSTSMTNLDVTKESVSSTLTYDLTIGGIGRSVGTAALTTERSSRVILVTTGAYTFTPEGSNSTYSVVAEKIVMDPVNNRNMVPEAGIRTIRYDIIRANVTIPATLVVTYTAESPSTGVVLISANGSEPVPYTLPRFL